MNLRFYRAPLLAALTLLTSACREESAEPKEIVIGFSQCCSDVFREAMLFDMQIESANYPNVRLVVRNADYDNELQRQQVAELTRSADPVDVLIVSPNEAEPLTDVTVDAYLRGIPTIILDRMINSDQYSVAIGADNYQIGRTAGRYIRQHLPPGSRILEIWGIPGSTPAVERHNGLLSTLGDSYRVDSVHGEWQPNIAAERIARLESYDDIDCIFAHNDVMALAAREAIMRRDSISGRRIRYLGIDATYGVGLEAIVDGRLDASFLYPTGGATAIRKAVELLQGVPVEKNVRLNTATIDRSNAQTLIAQAQQMEDYQRRINRQREELNALSVRFDYLQNSSLAIFCLTALLIPILIYALYANRKIRQKNRELHETNAQIEFQRRELTLKNAQLERASTSKLRFFTNISHEIRTPVSLIINPLQQITRQGNILPAPVYETLKLIIRNADRLLKMVNRILDVSRMEDQSEVLILTEIRIADFLRDVGRCFEPLAQTRKIRFTLQDHSGNAPLTIDADKIELIFMNLLSNAFRFTPDGGEITVRSTCDRDWVTIEVEDSGCGIPPERLPHIFKRFFTDDRNPGTGVGLHLCREITELHHGEISAENRPEGGGDAHAAPAATGNGLPGRPDRNQGVPLRTPGGKRQIRRFAGLGQAAATAQRKTAHRRGQRRHPRIPPEGTGQELSHRDGHQRGGGPAPAAARPEGLTGRQRRHDARHGRSGDDARDPERPAAEPPAGHPADGIVRRTEPAAGHGARRRRLHPETVQHRSAPHADRHAAR